MPEVFKPELMPRYAPFNGWIPSPGVASDSAPYNCVKISQAWIPIVIGALNALVYDVDYDLDEAGNAYAANEARRLILAVAHGNLYCVEDTLYLLRQNSTDPCVLEQSTDGGLTWSTAFDFGLCMGITSPPTMTELTNIVNATATATATLSGLYEGEVSDVCPDCVMDETEADEHRNDAMCYALSVLLATLEETIKAQEKHGIDWKDVARLTAVVLEVGSGLLLAASEIGIVNLDPKVAFGCYAVGILSAVVSQWIDEWGEEPDLTPLLDANVQLQLLCCAQSKLRGNTPSIGIFASIFDSCDIDGMNADTESMLTQLTENAGMYLQFLNFVGAGFDAIDGGQSVDCGCPTEILTFDFTAESGTEENTLYGIQDWEVYPDNAGCGVYTSGQGWVHGNETTADYTRHRGVHIQREGISGTINKVTIVYDMDYVSGLPPYGAVIEFGAQNWQIPRADVPEGTDQEVSRADNQVLDGDTLYCFITCYIKTGPPYQYAGSCKIKKIIIEGQNLIVA